MIGRGAYPAVIGALLIAACGAAPAPTDEAQNASEAGKLPKLAQADLQAGVTDPELKRFYALRGWQAVWTREREHTLFAALEQAEAHGLTSALFLNFENYSGNALQREIALTKAALGYAGALANGLVDPTKFRTIYTIPGARTDIASGLSRAIDVNRLGRWFAGLAPQDAQYRALSDAYIAYHRAPAVGHDVIAAGPTLRAGDVDPRVPAIVGVLLRLGYMREPAVRSLNIDHYSPQLAAAVGNLQDDFGLQRDGAIGPVTLRVLNRSSIERARQLAINLERLRWLERNPPTTRIDVNTGAAELVLWRDGTAVDRRRVAVGRTGWQTPQLQSPIYRLVANPSWTVPRSIAKAELSRLNAAELAQRNMQLRGGWFVQRPGPGNALGQVKFDMRDRYAIYLHDTPGKHVFSGNARHLSHGCVRVDDALAFARILADADGKRAAFDTALASGRETFVALDHEIPVRLIYLTAFLDGSGEVRFRPDTYGWDQDVGRAMKLGRGRRAVDAAPAADIGP